MSNFSMSFSSDLSITRDCTLHIDNLRGKNTHHIIETIFKSFGRALRMAVAIDSKLKPITPSTKGIL